MSINNDHSHTKLLGFKHSMAVMTHINSLTHIVYTAEIKSANACEIIQLHVCIETHGVKELSLHSDFLSDRLTLCF